MKLSRRGKRTKHARSVRYTKRAGKHLIYKSKSKKFRASKRYHRGGSGYTKKLYRRRVKKGGAVNFDDVPVINPDPKNPDINIYTVKGSTDDTITYRKIGTPMSDKSVFDIEINVESKDEKNVGRCEIILTRKKSPIVKHTFYLYELNKIIDNKNPEIEGINQENKATAYYDFSFKENMENFKAIRQKIEEITKSAKDNEAQKKKEKELQIRQQEIDNQRLKAEQEQLKKQAIEEFETNGDDLEVLMHYQTSEPYTYIKEDKVMTLKFSDFKKELEELAKKTKENIEKNEKIDPNNKKDRSNRVDDILKSELKEQRYLMKEIYIAGKAGYNIKESIGGKLSLLDKTSNRVKENLDSKNKIIDQANEDSLDWNYIDERSGKVIPIPKKYPRNNDTKPLQLTSFESRFYDHYGVDVSELKRPDDGLTAAERVGQRF